MSKAGDKGAGDEKWGLFKMKSGQFEKGLGKRKE